MASLRFLSGSLEILGGLSMLYLGTVPRALQVNGLLALVGPFILISVTAIGLAGIAGEVKLWRIGFILVGVAFILYGSKA